MTKLQKLAYVDRIRHALPPSPFRDQPLILREQEATRIFKATRAFHRALIEGSQQSKPASAVIDEHYRRAFPAILRAIR